MNTNVDLTLSLAADGSALPSLFFRPADRLRLEGCVAALTQEGRSLALSSQHDAALDHYGRLLTERLRRAAPQSQIETYFPASTDAMVARFNEVLAGQTMREAMNDGLGHASARIWVVHDAGALANHELELLARLVSNFPGANIRVVLMLGPALRSRKAFDALGRRFVRWDIEAPSPEQAQAMIEQARIEGCESLVTQLLRHLRPASPKSDSFEPAVAEPFRFQAGQAQDRSVSEPPTPRDGAAARFLQRGRSAMSAVAARMVTRLQSFLRFKRTQAKGPERRSGKGPRLPKARWIMAIGGLAALSIAVSAWLHGGRFGVSKPAVQQPVKDVRGGARDASPDKAASQNFKLEPKAEESRT